MKTSNKILTDKGYFGRLSGIKGAYIYKCHILEEPETNFIQFVYDHLYDYKQDGIKPQKTNLGNFNVRIGVDLHFRAYELKTNTA